MGRKRLFNDKEKWCPRCKAWLPLKDFMFNAGTPSGRQDYCAVCIGGKPRRVQPGFVYVIGNADLEKFKIGVSANPKKRLMVMRMHSPAPLELVKTIKVPDMWEAEREFHVKLKDKHSHGEWFTLSLDEARQL